MTYGLFILKDGAWKLLGTFKHASEAERERLYWVNEMGVQAKIFRKV